MRDSPWWWVLVLAGCAGGDAAPEAFDDAGGLLGEGPLNPFPSHLLVAEDGTLDVDASLLPHTDTPFPVDRVAWRTGFSPGQIALVRLPGVDPSGFPGWKNPTPGEGSVLLVDLTAGAFLPVMAELDAWPDAVDPTLLVRPQVALPAGHEIAAVVTTAAVPRPERFATLVDGNVTSPLVTHTREVVDAVTALGVPREAIALAWSWPTGDGTAPTRSAVAQIGAPGAFSFDQVRDADAGDDVPDAVWRNARGTFEVTDFLVDGGMLDLAGDGTVSPTGTDLATLVVSIPHSVRDAPAGTVPILVYGHGLLSSPEFDLIDADWAPHAIAEALGAIVVATPWRGLDYHDLVSALSVANDFGKMPLLTDKMVQGQANVHALVRLVREGDLLDHEIFVGSQGPIADRDTVLYWGISMGSILGGVFLALDDHARAGVLHVPGGLWSSLLERSRNWTQFEILVTDAVPDPADRQLFYAASQLFWDPVDPIAYTDDLREELVLFQESFGDDAVHNLTTRALARSIGLPLLTPSVDVPWALEAVPADLGPGSRALVQFDPEVGVPPNRNRPADVTYAHDIPSGWEETRHQAVDFLRPDDLARVVHYCGPDPCTDSTRAR